MATIKFLPVCSHCGDVLYGVTIDYERTYDEYDKCDIKIPRRIGYISPMTCPCCGEYFESIQIPTKLPYREDQNPSKIDEIAAMARYKLGLYAKD